MKITIINKILLCFICSIVPYISIKGQCLDSLKSVWFPDSIEEQIEIYYEDTYTNASKNVVNLISPNNYNFVDGIYAFPPKVRLCVSTLNPSSVAPFK